MSFRLLLINPFPPGMNPNPHLIDYVSSAGMRVLGEDNLHVAHVSEAVSHLPHSDAVLVFGSVAYMSREARSLSDICKRMKLPLGYWSTDDPYEIDLNLEIMDCFDWIWTNDRASIPFYDKENVTPLPLAADPKSHCLSFPEAESEYIHDVSFVGVEFQNRLNLLKELQLLLESVDSAVIGPNWTLEARFVQPMKVTNQEAAQISNRSRIVLNMGRSLDLANSRGIVPSTPGPRAFEVGGCSTVQLVTWDQPEIEEYYVLGEEIIFCDSVASIKDEVRDLVMNRRRREAIANASFKRTMSCHLYDHRMQEIVGRIHTLLQ